MASWALSGAGMIQRAGGAIDEGGSSGLRIAAPEGLGRPVGLEEKHGRFHRLAARAVEDDRGDGRVRCVDLDGELSVLARRKVNRNVRPAVRSSLGDDVQLDVAGGD